MQKNKTENKRFFSLLVFCLILLFNPSINVIDILPDFIAYFILARLFEDAADSAPYFEETRVGFIRLAWVNLSKIVGLFLIGIERSRNSFNNDIVPLVSLVFATVELIILIPTVKNLFDALFRLGERSDATALITPFPTTKRGRYKMPPEMLRSFTFLFAICKCVVYFLPDLFLLTKTNDRPGGTQIITMSKYYPYSIMLAQLIGLIVGAVWLSRMIKYIRAVRSQGKFHSAIDTLGARDITAYQNKTALRKMKSALTLLFIASIFSFELVFTNYNEINLFPHFIYGALLTLAMKKLVGKYDKSNLLLISGTSYCAVALLFYIFHTRFLVTYGYVALRSDPTAKSAYTLVCIFATVEFIALIFFLTVATLAMRKFVLRNTGISPASERYSRMEKEFHRSLLTKTVILISLAVVAGLSKFINVFVNGTLQQILFPDIDGMTDSMLVPSIEWFGLVVAATAIIYIGYSLYYSSVIKEELDMKYNKL